MKNIVIALLFLSSAWMALNALGVNTPAAQGQEVLPPPIQSENSISDALAPKYNAKREVRLWDDTRVDMVNDTYAIEVDWAKKWAEAIGQSLYYAAVTDKKPGIILLTKDRKGEQRFIFRCQTVCVKFGIKLYVEDVVADE